MVSVEIVIETIQRMNQHSHILCGYNTTYTRRTKCCPLVRSHALILLSQSIVFFSCLTCLNCLENSHERTCVYTVLKPLDLHVSLEQHLFLPTPETSIQGVMAHTWADTPLQPAMN